MIAGTTWLSRRGRRTDFLLGAVATLAAASVVRAPAKAAQFEFRMASGLPVTHPAPVRLTQMWAAIEQESGGRIHTEFFPASQLGTETATFSQLRLGALQFLLLDPGNIAAVVPITDIGYLGFAYKDVDEGFRVMDGPLGAYIRDEMAAKNIHAMRTLWDSGMYQIGSNTHAIRTPDDFRGFKIRVIPSRIAADLFKTMGAIPTALGFGEIYTALQTKVVDGTSTPLVTLVTLEEAKFYEVQKYISITNHAWSSQWLLANGDVWKGLPADLQDIIERNATRFGMMERRDTKTANAAAATKLGTQLAVNQVDQVPFRARLKPYYEYWANAFGSKAWGLLQGTLGRTIV